MKKTVLITGASSGIGRETAKYFQQKGWNVSASMRKPEDEKELNKLENVIIPKLDVTDPESIKNAIEKTIGAFGKIDVLVNNAGYSLVGVFEASSIVQIEKQFSVNVFGVMNVIREILPYFRNSNNGTIINISSIGGKMTFPLFSVYHATKFAIHGFSESLKEELLQFNIKVKVIEPGGVKTEFYGRSMDIINSKKLKVYDSYEKKTFKIIKKFGDNGKLPIITAKIIFKAANDNSSKFHYPSGNDAKALLALRKILPFRAFTMLTRLAYRE
jgi:NADP-dependent 3-hydroxy acid dehydrogenase YdfG